jgi:hypothetical protein
MDLISKFEDKLNEIEIKNCLACNHTMQSQKGHTCWLWNRIILDEDKYLYAEQAIEELNLSNEDRQKIYKYLSKQVLIEIINMTFERFLKINLPSVVVTSVFVNYFKNNTIKRAKF